MTRPDLYAAIYRAKRVAMELDCDHSEASLVFAALDRMEKAFRAEVDFAALCAWKQDVDSYENIDEVQI